jgi:putative transposase
VAERRLRAGQGPARGDQVGPNPTDRAKPGTKRGLLTEADGGPVAVALAPANRHDSLVLQDVLEAVVVEPPADVEQHLCLDKAFVGASCDATARVFGYEPHVRPIGEEGKAAKGTKKHKPRRWVVERAFAWLNRCRGIVIRYEKKAENYLAVVQLACALLWYRRLRRLTT